MLLAVYAVAWGWAALGRGVPGADDHPGQFYRLVHAITLGPAPWHWNPGWWAGYPELQYYPPGFFYLGYLLHWLGAGLASPGTIYLVLVWLVFLLPGAATYALLRRVLGSGWLALPGAFLALVVSAGSRSGIEEGLRWGLVASRLGWGLLPLLGLACLPWLEGAGRRRALPALLLAAIVLAHPAHTPMALILVLFAAALSPAPGVRRLAPALMVIGVGARPRRVLALAPRRPSGRRPANGASPGLGRHLAAGARRRLREPPPPARAARCEPRRLGRVWPRGCVPRDRWSGSRPSLSR